MEMEKLTQKIEKLEDGIQKDKEKLLKLEGKK